MEGSAPLLIAAALIPMALGAAGLLLLRTSRWLGILLLSAIILVIGLMAVFTLG